MSWYSGWSYKSVDKGLVIEFGSAYCADGMNAVDWAADNSLYQFKVELLHTKVTMVATGQRE